MNNVIASHRWSSAAKRYIETEAAKQSPKIVNAFEASLIVKQKRLPRRGVKGATPRNDILKRGYYG